MLIRYDGQSKAAYIRLLDSDVIESEEVAPGVVYDFDAEDRVRGIEFYRLDSLSKEVLSSLELPIHPQEKEILDQCLFSDLNKKSSVFTVCVEKTNKGNFVPHTCEDATPSQLPSQLEIS
jgi:uncharacterized protein YuzE